MGQYLETKKTACYAHQHAAHVIMKLIKIFLLTKTSLLVSDSCYKIKLRNTWHPSLTDPPWVTNGWLPYATISSDLVFSVMDTVGRIDSQLVLRF